MKGFSLFAALLLWPLVCLWAGGRERLRVDGVLKSTVSKHYYAPERGSIIFMAKEGSAVTSGERVLTLDASALEREIRAKQGERDQLRYSLEIKKCENELKSFELQKLAQVARAGFKVARVTLEQKQIAVDATEYVRIESSIGNKETRIARWIEEIAEKRPYVDRGFVSREMMEDLELALNTGELDLEALRLDLELLKKGAPEADIARARLELALAKAKAARAAIRLERFKKVKQVELENYSLGIEDHEKEIARLKKTVAEMTFHAPFPGIIVAGWHWKPGGKVKWLVGDMVYPGTRVVSVVDPGRLKVKMTLHESQASLLKIGCKGKFYPVAWPDVCVTGEISDIDRVAEHSSWDLFDSTWLSVTARLDSSDPKFRLGMSVFADFDIDRPAEAFSVSAAPMFPGDVARQKFRIKKGSLFVRVKIDGEMEPDVVKPVKVRLMLEDQVKINKLATEGSLVEKGEVVAVLDSLNVLNELREKKLSKDVAEKELALLKQKGKLEIDRLRHALELAVLARRVAELEQKILLTVNPFVLEDARIDLQMVDRELAGLKRRLDVKREMSERGYVSDREVDDLLDKMAAVKTRRDVAAVKLELVKGGPTRRERVKAELKLKQAELEEQLARRKLESTKTKLHWQLLRAECKTRMAVGDLEHVNKALESTRVTAPVSGVVLIPSRWTNSGPAPYKEGDAVSRGVVFMRIARLESVHIKGWLPEQCVDAVRLGQKAEFFFPTDPRHRFRGRVVSIGACAFRRPSMLPGQVTERVFEVVVKTDEYSKRFQPGVSIQLEIVIKEVRDAPLLPLSALFADANGAFVELPSGARKKVTVLGCDAKFAAVRGLKEGDVVLGGIDPSAY